MIFRFLLENNANVHAQTQTGDTALTYACENGHTDVAEILLYFGAKLEHESEGGRTPLMKACRAGHICTVKFLIAKGADVNRHTTNNDHTSLSLACAGGHQPVVELLLKNGADPFHKLKDNSTMLIEASKGGHIGVVQLLLDFPHSLVNPSTSLSTAAAVVTTVTQTSQNVFVTQHHQSQQPIMKQSKQQLQQQQQTHLLNQHQHQILPAPPGLHEVPEAIRVSNQQLFQQQQHQLQIKDNYLEQQMLSKSRIVKHMPTNLGMDQNNQQVQHIMNAATIAAPQSDSIMAKMRLDGFKEGLAQGLARSQPSANPVQVIQNTCNIINQTAIQCSSNKQKSLLRKNRHTFETNLTTSEVQQVRSQPIGEDENTNLVTTQFEDHFQQHPKPLIDFQKVCMFGFLYI